MDIAKSSLGEFSVGNDSVGQTAKQVVATGYAREALNGITIRAFTSNTGTLYIGNNAGVNPTNSYQLPAGEEVVVPVDFASKVWIVSDNADPSTSKYNWISA